MLQRWELKVHILDANAFSRALLVLAPGPDLATARDGQTVPPTWQTEESKYAQQTSKLRARGPTCRDALDARQQDLNGLQP